MAASTTSTALSLSSSSTLIAPPPPRLQSQCAVYLPAAAAPSQPRLAKTTTAYCRKIARDVVAMATTSTGEAAAPAEVVVDSTDTADTSEILKTIQELWDKVDDKYAVTSLGVAGGVALWASAGMISAIDRLPLVPGVLELVGIGYTGWFAYKNLLSKPDRDSLIKKVKDTYYDIIGTS